MAYGPNETLAKCTICKELRVFPKPLKPGRHICTLCRPDILARRKRDQDLLKARVQKIYRAKKYRDRHWNNLRGPDAIRKRWIVEFGKGTLVCARCKHSTWYNISLHHIKYYGKDFGDHTPDNLLPLCLNCHAIEHITRGIDDYGY